MSDGFAENGIFYYGAREPKSFPDVEEVKPEIGSYDPDESDSINARRYFGFTDYEEIDIFVLRSRRHDRRGQWRTEFYFRVLVLEAK
jgi:hypothetical protein